MALAGTLPHFDKDQGAVRVTHHDVDFPPAPPGRPIIAGHQRQIGTQQVRHRPVFARIAQRLFGKPF